MFGNMYNKYEILSNRGTQLNYASVLSETCQEDDKAYLFFINGYSNNKDI